MALDLRTRPSLPKVLDNTMVTTFIECPTRFAWRHLWGFARGLGIDLHAGAAFAKGIETVRRYYYAETSPYRGDIDRSLAEGFRAAAKEWGKVEVEADEVKRFPRVCGALEYYFSAPDAFMPATDHIQPVMHGGEPQVEWNAVHPIDVKHPETGEPFLITGRFDMFGLLRGERLVILDEKTTQQLGGQWVQRWRMRSQFTTYIWLAQQFGYKVDTAIVRGIAFYKHNYANAEAIVYRQPWHIEMWYENLIRVVTRMVEQWERGRFDMALGEACASYGGCMFQDLCDTPDPQSWVSQYRVEHWNPLVRHKIPLEHQAEKQARVAYVED
jgi:hypothetical protein